MQTAGLSQADRWRAVTRVGGGQTSSTAGAGRAPRCATSVQLLRRQVATALPVLICPPCRATAPGLVHCARRAARVEYALRAPWIVMQRGRRMRHTARHGSGSQVDKIFQPCYGAPGLS
jgi:hypothetical protein